MVRQCAWCLRLIDVDGERISPSPLPKLYDATHGMCGMCGVLWMSQVLGGQEIQRAGHGTASASANPEEEAVRSVEILHMLSEIPLQGS